MISLPEAARRGQLIAVLTNGRFWAENPKIASRMLVLGVLGASAYFGIHASFVPIAVIYGLLGAAFIAQFQKVALPLVVVGIAFVPFQVGTGSLSAINFAFLGVGGLVAIWAVRMLLDRHVALLPSEANTPWMVLVAVTGLSIVAGAALWNPWVVTKSNFIFVQLAQWAIFVVSAFAFWVGGNATHDRRPLEQFVVIVLSLCSLVFLARIVPALAPVARRILVDGPVFRLWAVALAGGLACFHTSLDRKKRAGLFIMAAAFVLLPLYQARDWASGWMPSMMALIAVVLLAMWQRYQRVTAYLVTIAALLLTVYLVPQIASEDAWSLNTRLVAWRGLAELLEGRWLMGLGLASYWHYWRGVFGVMQFLDPATGYLHYTFDPKVNMHNNLVDIVGQSGILGLAALAWLMFALFRQSLRGFIAEPPGFGRAFAAACVAGLVGMLMASMLADWIFPFVYNIALSGYRSSVIGWLLLGGIVALEATRAPPAEPLAR